MKVVALLRGINVGKSVQVPMKTLKGLLEDLGFQNVVTYLNSGNAVFDSPLAPEETSRILETEFQKRFGQSIPTLVKTGTQMIEIQKAIPPEWNNDGTEQTYVAYLFPDVARPEILAELPIKKEYVTLLYAHEAIIWNIKRENYNRSQITKIASHEAYARMTTRNVNSARKLAQMCLLEPSG